MHKRALRYQIAKFWAMMDAAHLNTISAIYDTHLAAKCIWHGPAPFYALQKPHSVAQHFWQTVKTAISSLRQETRLFFAGASPDRIDGGMDEATSVCNTSYVTGEARHSFYDIPDSDTPLQREWAAFYELKAEDMMAKKILLDFVDWFERINFSTLLKHRSIAHVYRAPASCDKLIRQPRNDAAAAKVLRIRSPFLYFGLNGYAGTNFYTIRMAGFFHPKAKWYDPSGGSTSPGLTAFQTWHQLPWLATLPDPEVQELNAVLGATGKVGIRSTHSRPTLTAPAGGKPVTALWLLRGNGLIENWFFFDLVCLFSTLGKGLLGSLWTGSNHCIETVQ